MRSRSNLLVLLGIAFFVVGGVIVYLLTSDESGDVSGDAARVTVLVGTEDIPAGAMADDLIDAGKLEATEVAAGSLSPGSIGSVNQLEGATFVQGYAAGQPITSVGLQLQNRTFEVPEGFAMVFVGGGLALLVVGLLSRVYEREEQLADILDLPWGERDIDLNATVEQHSSLVENTIGVAGRFIGQVDTKGNLLTLLERARLPIRPGEFMLFVISGGVVLGAFMAAITSSLVFGAAAALVSPFLGVVYLRRRIARRTRRFEAQFPDALTLIASSLGAGHTFLRSIQMMCEEAEAPISEEFARIVSDTQLGDPLVDALGRMATRLEVRDVDWVVQAIRIQQTVGGNLADVLHTLADFIRAREEIRREIDVLTAEGRVSAYVLGALPLFLGMFVQVSNPGYMDLLFQGWGWIWLGGSVFSVVFGMFVIFRMIKVEI